MKKVVILAMLTILCAIASVCSAFEIDRNQWISYANVNNIEAFYSERSIQKNGDTAKIWLCYHYTRSDTYRLMQKEYVRGSNRAKILKTLDYYSDGTLKRASSNVVHDVGLGANEDIILQRIW